MEQVDRVVGQAQVLKVVVEQAVLVLLQLRQYLLLRLYPSHRRNVVKWM
jgi:hypothetical protein